MATVTERFEGRTEVFDSGRDRAEIPYLVAAATGEADVRSAAQSQVPAAYAGLERISIEITERVNADTWKVLAIFGDDSGGGTTTPQDSWPSLDHCGGTQHIRQSLKTVDRYGPKASNVLGGAIGYDGETVQGVDITVPIFNFTETHYLQDAVVTRSYRHKVFQLTGKVNKYGFKGFDGGEVLFMGANGAKRGGEEWEVTFRFAALPNQTGIRVGDITGIAKKGWDYLWVQYADEVDPAINQVVKKPVAVYIEQVYEMVNLSALGIGH